MFFKKNKEVFEILMYLIAAVILVYYIPSPFNKVLFLGVLPLAWRTKRDYLWLAFFFIVEDIPGGLFSGGLASDPYRFPLYSITTGISFSLRELYLILILIKVLYQPEFKQTIHKNYFRKELSMLGYYLIVLLFISTMIGMSVKGYRDFYKMCIGLSLFISVPRIIKDRDYLIRFFNVLFPFAIIAILLQVYSLSSGQQLIAVFKPDVLTTQGVLSGSGGTEKFQRPIEMVHVLLVCFTGSLFFLNKGERYFKSGYLVAINLLSFVGIFLTGTRTWILALGILYIYFFLTIKNQSFSGLSKKVFITTILIIGLSLIPVIRNQISNAWSRLSTLEQFVKGDITAGGTSSRFDVRAPIVMEGFKSSTIIAGAGFSDSLYHFGDRHVGYQNMLLNSGLIGMILFSVIILKAIFLPYNLSKSKEIFPRSKRELRASILLLIALLVINTGTQMLGFTPDGDNRFLLMALALTFINIAINSAFKDNQSQDLNPNIS